ncbi:hypothetical protein QBC38DRAFT_182269 [Podospora fimiseda]|uniref:Uncharacterized protein n=1 Tax=Podospora fimiseda TaxID=252190 RepID=A0AAN7BQY6_9PEZI|nr:hypothetical protein QBC38DRAFT_182269 [Podospora fimiseda]
MVVMVVPGLLLIILCLSMVEFSVVLTFRLCCSLDRAQSSNENRLSHGVLGREEREGRLSCMIRRLSCDGGFFCCFFLLFFFIFFTTSWFVLCDMNSGYFENFIHCGPLLYMSSNSSSRD